jgi:7-carboxy-7-deazaguanine synthase
MMYRLSEVGFLSIQGEGRYAGTPSIWARVFGCNLKCPGFACDTEYSWNPKFKNDHDTYTSQEIYTKLKDLITNENNPNGLLIHPLTGNDIHIVFTGGEPLLKKYQKMIQEVVDLFLVDNYYVNFTLETNGTQPLTEDFTNWLDKNYNVYPFFSISPKLESVSWEKGAVDISNINSILDKYQGQLKFVANDTEECETELLETVRLIQGDYEYWVMPLGATKEDQLDIAPIVERYQALGFKIALRGHTYIWSDAKNR